MGLKILHTADWHLGSPFGSFPEKQQALLKQEQRQLPGRIAELCLRENCDMMLLAGDIFDGNPGREIVEEVKRALAHSGVPVLIAPGNHDYCTPGSPWLTESWPENVFVFTEGLESVTIHGLDCRIYGAAYHSMDCEGLLEGFRAEGNETYRIAVLHGDPVQLNSPYCPITAAQIRDSGLQYLALGHIHKAGAFQVGDTVCAWPGCPMGRGWDETGEKGVCIVELSDTVQLHAVSLDAVQFHVMDVEVEGDAAAALEGVLPAAGNRDFYRISLTGSGPVDIGALKRKFDQFPNLELRDSTDAPLDIWGSADEDSLEGIYFSMLRQAMEESPREADRIQLAAEISRRLLSGREVTL